jgi:hypothetical protein
MPRFAKSHGACHRSIGRFFGLAAVLKLHSLSQEPNLICLPVDRLFDLLHLRPQCPNLTLQVTAAAAAEERHDHGNQNQRSAAEADFLALHRPLARRIGGQWRIAVESAIGYGS